MTEELKQIITIEINLAAPDVPQSLSKSLETFSNRIDPSKTSLNQGQQNINLSTVTNKLTEQANNNSLKVPVPQTNDSSKYSQGVGAGTGIGFGFGETKGMTSAEKRLAAVMSKNQQTIFNQGHQIKNLNDRIDNVIYNNQNPIYADRPKSKPNIRRVGTTSNAYENAQENKNIFKMTKLKARIPH
jgi:hypothetical protein